MPGIVSAVLVLMTLLLPAVSRAAPTVDCHCFRDRSFDPARPTASNDYILATSRNSMLASVYGVHKKEIVRARMSGTSALDLWIALDLARTTGQPVTMWLERRAGSDSWQQAMRRQKVETAWADWLDKDRQQLYDRIVALTLRVDDAVVRSLRADGADDRELVAALVLAPLLRETPVKLLRQVRANGGSWGARLHGAGISPTDIGSQVAVHVTRERLDRPTR
ncbi:MAG: hypothetical protein Kow00100_14730 [Geothermobacteraceae bacterium]